MRPPALGATALPGRDDAAGAGDDRDQRQHVVGLELGLDDQIDMAGRQHAIGVAVAAVAREPHRVLDPAEGRAVGLVHQQRAGGEQHRLGEVGAGPHLQRALARRTAVVRRAAVAAEAFAGERLVHHAVDRLAVAHQRDQRAPGRHAGDEGLGAVDRIEHPDIFGVGALAAEFLADDAVIGKGAADEGAHRGFGRVVGGGHRIEAAGPALVLDAQRGAEERQDGFAGDGRQSFTKAAKSMAVMPPAPRSSARHST